MIIAVSHARNARLETPPFIMTCWIVVVNEVLPRKAKPIQLELVYLVEEEYLVTALVPSETACLASSPGRMRRTEVWISREEMVDFLL